ncbi:MAG: methyltransferase domain-containing protein [Nitrospirae bacterium]|nr:methyltransferase domain-containing protein [Nitrospirota bacterium]
MKIAYLLDDTSLCGGVKVVFEHARMLSRNGFRTTIISKGDRPQWAEMGDADFRKIEGEFADRPESLSGFDLVIATFYRQVLELYESPIPLVHFSQGYEADCPFWKEMREEIERAYRLPVPRLTVSRVVAAVMENKFSQTAVYIPQGIDLSLFPRKDIPDRIRKILIVGAWENEVKGIRFAVQGFVKAKQAIKDLALVRISTMPLSDEERAICNPDEFYTSVDPLDMPGIYGQCSVCIVPSLEGEGFGLPAIEAMACGLPVILTRIPSFLSFGVKKDYAYFVPPASAEDIGKAIEHLNQRPDLLRMFALRGREVAEGFSIINTEKELVSAINSLSAAPVIKIKPDTGFIYIGRPLPNPSIEERLLRELSKSTFKGNSDGVTLISENASGITIGEIPKATTEQYICLSLDDSMYFSKNWLSPLIEALEKGFELASPVCIDFFDVAMPYYSPLSFNASAELQAEKYEGNYISTGEIPPFVFLVRRDSLFSLPPETLISGLPGRLKSCLVPASLVHRFGDYYAMRRDDILPFLPHGVKKILDVGCAKGLLGEVIKKERGCEVYGVEMNRAAADEAKGRLDDVFCLDVEKADLPFDEDLDAVIFADILEHLVDPWLVLEKAGTWLKPEGIVIASVPNVSHYAILSDLLQGRWDYIPAGLLCISHLRFFTRKSIEEMFLKCGYHVLTLAPHEWPTNLEDEIKSRLSAHLNVCNLGKDIFTSGYYVVAQKASKLHRPDNA